MTDHADTPRQGDFDGRGNLAKVIRFFAYHPVSQL
jgi:hypothetical protein